MSQLALGLGGTPTPGRGARRTPARTPKRTPSASSSGSDCSSVGNGHIKVVVRVRPPNSQELEGNYKNVIQVLDDHMLVFDPKEENSPDYYHRKRRQGRNMLQKANRDIRFAFDQVYDIGSSNQEVYELTTKTALDALLDGFNCSVFAYGATGAGKTFTMLGRADHPGVMFLTMVDLYTRIDAFKETKSCDVAVSYLEVYNEQIRDLLMPDGYLPIREDPQKGVIISGLSLHKPRSAQELMHMLEFGNKNRTQHPTDANAESSRSHAVFQVFVRMKDRTAGLSADVTVAKMSLIDLAGSERATVTTNRGARFREGANINRSLLALGNCINALAEGKAKGYVPYRNSKLTRLLKDSLGGNCKTVMIAAVSPSAMSFEDTYNTLKYANRAKNIKANLTRRVVSVDYHVTKYVQIVEELRTEVTELKDKLSQYQSGAVLPAKCSRLDDAILQDISRMSGLLLSVFEERVSIRKELMEMEGSWRDLAFKIHLKHISVQRIRVLLTDPTEAKQATNKLESAVAGFQKRQETVTKRKCAIEARVEENNARLERAEADMKHVQKNSPFPQLLETELRCRHLEVELRDTRRHVRHLKKLCRQQQRAAKAQEHLVTKLLLMGRNQYYILKGHGLATSDINQEFENLQQLIEGKSGVNFEESIMERSVSEAVSSSQSPCGASQSQDATQFDINPLVEFPVLSCVPITPKTPHRRKSRMSLAPGAGSTAVTPCTPFTPGVPMTPVTPATPAWPDDSSLGVAPLAPSTPVPSEMGQSTCSNNSSSTATTDIHNNNSHVISKAISSTVQQCLNISTMSHTSVSTVDSSQYPHSTSHTDSSCVSDASSKGAKNNVQPDNRNMCTNRVPTNLSSVRAKNDVTSGQTASSDVSNVRALADVSNVRVYDKVHPERHRDFNETFTFNPSSVQNARNMTPTQKRQMGTPKVVQTTKVTGTVTKDRPSANVNVPVVNTNTITKTSNTVPGGNLPHAGSARKPLTPGAKGAARMNMPPLAPADVLKMIETAGLRETPPQDNGRRTSVVRVFNFDHMPGPNPAGQRTFAEALKSPALKVLKNETFRINSPRSPLTPRENLPPRTPDMRPKKLTFAQDALCNKQRPASSRKQRQHPYSASKAQRFQGPQRNTGVARRHSVYVGKSQLSEDVKRMGLPSILEKRAQIMQQSAASGTPSGDLPGYMQLTKAASRRRKHHRRHPKHFLCKKSSSNEDAHDKGKTLIPTAPRRVATKENTKPSAPPQRIPMSKSKSAIHLGSQKSTFF